MQWISLSTGRVTSTPPGVHPSELRSRRRRRREQQLAVGMADTGSVGIESLEDAYRRQRPSLVRLAYVLTGSAEIAEDVVHDAFVATSRRWADLDNTDGYLRRAVINHARTSHRRAGRERDKALRLGGQTAASEWPPEIDETWALLATLTARQRAALVLRFYEDLPEAEIAELLGCRPGTVKSLLHRGLAKVREALL